MSRLTEKVFGAWQIKECGSDTCKETCDKQPEIGCDNCPIRKAIDKLAAYENKEESEKITMTHNVTVTTEEEKTVEEYWELKAVQECVKDVDDKYFDALLNTRNYNHEPTIEEIAQFLSDTKADFVMVSHNYRLVDAIPFV